jgi:hypothetical protein
MMRYSDRRARGFDAVMLRFGRVAEAELAVIAPHRVPQNGELACHRTTAFLWPRRRSIIRPQALQRRDRSSRLAAASQSVSRALMSPILEMCPVKLIEVPD